ncbi:MAG TPA: hypothetical protein VMU47_17615 [Caldimonas sp.]|nr:hypothetical protein [Caldimonas sp.]
MLPNRSLWLPPTSGFVPLGSGGALEGDVLEPPVRPAVPRRPPLADEAHPVDTVAAPAKRDAPRLAAHIQAWQPATTLQVRRVEMAVLAAICGYFSMGLVKLLGLF